MRNFINLLSVGFLLYVFTFYMDGEMGVILIAFMVSALVLSIALAVYGRKRIRVSIDCDAYVKRGSTLTVKVTVRKEGRFPLPVVDIIPAASGVFAASDKTYRLSLAGENSAEFEYELSAETGGNGQVYIKAVYSCGFLGFTRFKAAAELPEKKIVGVIPEIPDVAASSQLFRSIADAVITSDNDEENDTAMLFSANTSPGYEHREYVPGDSLKRVNWKLSSKTSKLMVRLDEAAAAVQPCIVLDLFRRSGGETAETLRCEERLIQSVFGLITLLVKNGIACTVVYASGSGDIICESVDNPEYPSQLLLKLLAVKVEEERRVHAGSHTEHCCSCIIATTDAGEGFEESIASLPDKENSCVIIPDSSRKYEISLPVWCLTEDNNFKLV